MKHFFKKTMVVILAICMLMPLLTFVGSFSAAATTNSEAYTKDLSSVRKTYISGDNVGYTSTTNKSLPFGSALTGLSVGSNTSDSFDVDATSSKGVPVVRINNATDFVVYINFADKTKGTILHEWSTDARNEKTNISEKYTLSHDSWGATQTGNDKQTVSANGLKITTGEIGTGALIVQTSKDGNSWTNVARDKYAKGLYTTNVLNYYHGTTQSYALEGSSIKEGTFVSVSFFYEVKKEYTYYYTTQERYWYQHLLFGIPIGGTHTVEHYDDKTEYLNVCETYKFYVTEDNPEVVTFNNLTTADKTEIVEVVKPSSQNEEEYQAQSEQYNNYVNSVIDQVLPTMHNGDMSTTGFRINVTANPYLGVSVKRNGAPFSVNKQNTNGQTYYEVTESGKYDITISSYSKQKTLTLYVDTASADDAYKRYFGEKVLFNGQAYGDDFLDYSPNNPYSNVRVFDAYSKVPVFVGSLTLNLKELTDINTLPLYGVVTNRSTGNVSFVDANQITLSDYGEYEVLFSSNADYYERVVLGNANIEMAGDVRVYKFNFKVVGKDSDTTVNEQLLSTGMFKDLSIASPSDYDPLFYGVKRSSANKGEVIVAFADKESALKYAKAVVWSEIETHTDSNGNTYWLIPNIENPFGAKVESYSGWKNAQVVRELAEKMVEERHFDLTKSASYLTLEKSVEDFDEEGVEVSNLLTNLQLASLEKSVIIWYSADQRSAATTTNTTIGETNVITFVGKKNYALLAKGENNSYSEIVTGERDYRFIKDVLGIDSHTLTAEDALGNTFALNYEEGLVAQLKANNCSSGLVLVTETNIYGQVAAEYYVYYIADGYQPATLTFSADGQSIQVSQGNVPEAQTFNKLRIEDISNYVDPYAYIRITNKSSNTPTTYYSITEAIGLEFTDSADYELAIIDRFGNSVSYEFSIN